MKQTIETKKQELQAIFNRKLGIPALTLIHQESSKLSELQHRLSGAVQQAVGKKQNDLLLLGQQLELLNPLHLLLKGYTKIEHGGSPIHSVTAVNVGDSVNITMNDGSLTAKVEEIITNG